MELEGTESKPCPTCKGAGNVITGYGVVCTELVEKVKKCPACKGKGRIYSLT
jgi:DnaJ-class molecular chaperone